MTEKMDELLQTLDDLRALSIKKKYRLARPEHDEVVRTFSAVCRVGHEGVNAILEALTDFPSNTGAEVVAENWVEISEHLEEFYKALQGAKYKTELGKRLRLLIGQHLSSKAPEVAMTVIFDVFEDMKHAKMELPTSKDLKMINSTLLAEGASVLTRLPLDSGTHSKSAQLVSFCLGAVLSLEANGKSLATPQTQLALIRWANGQLEYLDLGKEIQGIIADRLHAGNNDFLNLLRSEIDLLHPSLKDPINTALVESTGSQLQPGSAVEASSVPIQEVESSERTTDGPTQRQTDTSRDYGDTYDALAELERLSSYFRQIATVLNRRKGDIIKLERDLRKTEDELERTRREKDDAKRRCSIIENDLLESQASVRKLEQRVNSCEVQIGNLTSKLVSAENRHKEAVESYNAHADELSKRIAQEGDHRVTTFRNKLAGMLRPVAANLEEVRNMEMTPELGIGMRTQLRQILNILKIQGVVTDGNDR